MTKFIFLYPWWFCALLPIIILFILFNRVGKNDLIAKHLAKTIGLKKPKNKYFNYCLAIFWLLVILSLAGPSWREVKVPNYNPTNTRVLVLDMSKSLYATDFSPNRLEQMRYKALDLLDLWKEGKTGLVVYADAGYVLSPLTEDSQNIKEAVRNIRPDLMPGSGSNAVDGVKQAIKLLEKNGLSFGNIIILTDGIDADSKKGIENDLNQASKIIKLAGSKWHISILAIATSSGAPILQSDGKLMQKSDGETIIAKLELNPLMKITQRTSGFLQIIRADDLDIKTLINQNKIRFDKLKKTSQSLIKQRQNDGYWLLFPILFLTMLIFRRGYFLQILGIITIGVGISFFPKISYANSVGNISDNLTQNVMINSPWFNQQELAEHAYKNKNYGLAIKYYEKLINDKSDQSKQVKLALGFNYDKNGNFDKAAKIFKSLANNDFAVEYNLANSLAKLGKYQEAINSYNRSISLNSSFKDAYFNRAIVEKLLKNQQNKDNQKNSDKNQQNKDKQKNNDKNQQNKDNQKNNDKNQQNKDNQKNSDKNQQNKDNQKNSDKNQQNKDNQKNSDQNQQDENKQNNNDKNQQDENKQKNNSKNQQDENKQKNNDKSQQDGNKQRNNDKSQQNEKENINKKQNNESSEKNNILTSNNFGEMNQTGEIYKTLEQVNVDKGYLLKAQMYLDAQERANKESGTQ